MAWRGGAAVPQSGHGVGLVAASRLILVRVGDIDIEVEAVPVAGTEPTAGRATRAAGNVLEAFGRAQDAIIEVAKSTAEMIEKSGAAARPDRVEVEFGLKFSASGTVIMAGVAGEASLKVTLGYDIAARPAGGPPATALTALASDEPPAGPPAGSS
jgi:Trypsin-co-occurring domain 1